MELVITVRPSKPCRGAGVQKDVLAVLYHGSRDLGHLLLTGHILVFTNVKGQIDTYILIDDSSAVAFCGKAFFFQLVKIPAYCLLRNVIELAQLADYHSFFCLQFFEDQIPSL